MSFIPAQFGQVKRFLLVVIGILSLSAGLLIGCSNKNDVSTPVELALLKAANFNPSGSFQTGDANNYVEFDLIRERDRQKITQSLPVLISPLGRAGDQANLVDTAGNTIFTQRAFSVLGNGLDQNQDGIPDPLPTNPPNVDSRPLITYVPPAGWQARSTLAYVPNQTDVPLRDPSARFGLYIASILPIKGTLQFTARDSLGSFFPINFDVTFTPGTTQSVTVTVDNATSNGDQPVAIAICNQLNGAALVGLKAGNATTLDLIDPRSVVVNPALDAPTTYLAEAYQFDSRGSIRRISSNPTDPSRSTVPLVGGSATVSLVDWTDATRTTCFGDKLSDMRLFMPGFFR